MKNAPKITDAEYAIMKTLWRRSPMTASEIIHELREETGWNPKTIHTLISRLVTKRALEIVKENPYHYAPLVSEEAFRSAETKSFINRVYNGSVHHLVAHFIKDESLSREEIDELKRLLNR